RRGTAPTATSMDQHSDISGADEDQTVPDQNKPCDCNGSVHQEPSRIAVALNIYKLHDSVMPYHVPSPSLVGAIVSGSVDSSRFWQRAFQIRLRRLVVFSANLKSRLLGSSKTA